MRYYQVTVRVLVPVGEGGYGDTAEAAGHTLVEDIREVLGVGSTAGLYQRPELVGWADEPWPECEDCGSFELPCTSKYCSIGQSNLARQQRDDAAPLNLVHDQREVARRLEGLTDEQIDEHYEAAKARARKLLGWE